MSVRVRQRELAIRAAFGASRREIVRLVLREEMLPALLALSGGLLTAVGVARMLAGSLFRTSPTDPAVYLFIGIVLLAVIAGATYFPARRAGATHPGRELRA